VGVSRLGSFYAANIAGAVLGCLLAGFYLLRVHDVVVATYVAVAVNATVASVGLLLAMAAPYTGPEAVVATDRSPSAAHPWSVYMAIALSGLSAMGAEVVWTRQLSLLLGATTYTFSIILAVFLVGLGIGSAAGSMLARGEASPRRLLGWCQMALVAAIGWTAYMVACSLPKWPIDVSITTGVWYSFQLDIARCLWAVLPPACLWGASFPLALAAAASRGQDPGRLVGRVYAANTVGAIIGSLLFSIWLICWVGTQGSQQILMVLSAVAAVLMLGPFGGSRRAIKSSEDGQPFTHGVVGWLGSVCLLGLTGLTVWSVPPLPGVMVAYGRTVAKHYKSPPQVVYWGEGMNSSIAICYEGLVKSFHCSGKICASDNPDDMRMQRMLGHLPAVLHGRPRKVLVVGCGAGVAAGALTRYPGIEKIVICEIEPLVPWVAAKYFGEENYRVVNDPRRGIKGDKHTEIIYDDARHYINTTEEKFDLITSDPVDPWIKGAASLYTVEYLELCKRHLNPGGFMVQWAPLYETDTEAVKSQIATFMTAFPQGTIWNNEVEGSGYDCILLGQVGPNEAETDALQPIDVDALQQRLDHPDYKRVQESLDEVGLGSAVKLLATYGGRGPDLAEWLADAQINYDRSMRLEYLAGIAVNRRMQDEIFRQIMRCRRYPEALFMASDSLGSALRAEIKPPP
jgi:spermidine synthase